MRVGSCPATLGLGRGVWFRIRQGIRGLLVPDERGNAVVSMIVELVTHDFQVMTRSTRMHRAIHHQTDDRRRDQTPPRRHPGQSHGRSPRRARDSRPSDWRLPCGIAILPLVVDPRHPIGARYSLGRIATEPLSLEPVLSRDP
jgi:hypothetical protein